MPESTNITARQVAARAKVSQTTVSFVLNNVQSANISEETRQRVLSVAAELGYVPDAAARSLARGRSSNIGLVLIRPHQQVLGDTFITNIITGLNQAIHDKGFRILIEIVNDHSMSGIYNRLAKGKEVAGMVVVFYKPRPEDFRQLEALNIQGFPIVVVGKALRDMYSVYADHLSGVRRAVSHLIDLDHKRIGCITYGPIDTDSHAARRLQVYRETLEAAGLPFDPSIVHYGAYTPDTGYQAMLSMLNAPYLPTALFAMNDSIAFGAMAATKERGLRIPDDIAVIGYDDNPMARYTTPPLTTVHTPDVEQGSRAGELTIKLLSSQRPAEKRIKLDSQLVIRAST